jgi:hypothetical protein
MRVTIDDRLNLGQEVWSDKPISFVQDEISGPKVCILISNLVRTSDLRDLPVHVDLSRLYQ